MAREGGSDSCDITVCVTIVPPLPPTDTQTHNDVRWRPSYCYIEYLGFLGLHGAPPPPAPLITSPLMLAVDWMYSNVSIISVYCGAVWV